MRPKGNPGRCPIVSYAGRPYPCGGIVVTVGPDHQTTVESAWLVAGMHGAGSLLHQLVDFPRSAG